MGDVHGNDTALRAVLNAASAMGVERLLITGDIVGYYFAPKMVLDLLGQWRFDAVAGNHEIMLAEARNNPEYLLKVESKYGGGLRVALEQLNRKEIDYLCGLPHPLELEIEDFKILLCHGSPRDLNHYVYPDNDGELSHMPIIDNYDLVILGHTHYPMLKKVENTIIVNPGSVGQQRDRQPGACWALLDTNHRKISMLRESYDSSDLVRECQKRHPELPYLSEVLTRN